MSTETLFTFVIDSVPPCTRVDLFGSWDNFAAAYPMKRDSRRGRGHWTGCHRYKDIICDGDLQKLTQRDGCLLAGGTYWYYYKRDDLVEFHNAVEPSTSACPLLPGQILNVLELPGEDALFTEAPELDGVLDLDTFTLDPAMRFQNPKPWSKPLNRPVTVGRGCESKSSSHTTDGAIWARAANAQETPLVDFSEGGSNLTMPSDGQLFGYQSELPASSRSGLSSKNGAARSQLSWVNSASKRPQSRGGVQPTWIDQPLSSIKTSGVLLSYVQALATFSIDRVSHHRERPHTSSCIPGRPEFRRAISRSRTATVEIGAKRCPGISQQGAWTTITESSRAGLTEHSGDDESLPFTKIYENPSLNVDDGSTVSETASLAFDPARRPDETVATVGIHHQGNEVHYELDLELGSRFSPGLSFPSGYSDASSQSSTSCGFDRLGSSLSNTASTASSPAIHPIAACIRRNSNNMSPSFSSNCLLPEVDCRFESQETIMPPQENNIGITAPLAVSRGKERPATPPPPSRNPPPPPLVHELPVLQPGIGNLDLSLISWESLDAR